MKRKLSALTVCVLSSSAVASAMAADVYQHGGLKDEVSYSAPARSWTGLWIGALGGFEISNSKLKANEEWHCENYATGDAVTIDGLGQQGVFGELQIGYDRQISQRIVAGLFGGLNLNNAEFDVDASAFQTHGSTTKTDSANLLSFEQKWGGVIGPRLGYLTSPSTMFYVAGGWAFGELGKVKSDGKDVFTTANGFSHNQDTSLSGVFGELGMETQLDGNLYLKVAGRYTHFGAVDLFSESEGNATEGASAHGSLDLNQVAVMGGLTWKFSN